MPRIDPQQLLNCLSVLLASNGGIKSSKEVNRLVLLMGKFSKKLVSKCIYVQILKSTETELLGQFMADGGWALSHTWLQDGILTRNWPLVQELLELMLLCPVDVQRLKSNSAPKLVKGLSKEGGNEGVRILASKLVEQWLKIVKGETSSITPVTMPRQDDTVLKPDIPDEKQEIMENGDMLDEADETEESEDMVDPLEIPTNHVPEDDANTKERLSKAKSDGLVYKITVKDGKQVLAKVEASPKKEADADKAKTRSEVVSAKIKSEPVVKAKTEPIAKLKIETVDGKKQIKDKIKKESAAAKEQDKAESIKKSEKSKSDTAKSEEKERRSSKESTDSKETKDSKEKRKESSSKSSSSKHSSSSSKSSSHKSSRSSSDSKHKSSSSSSSSRDKSKDSEKDKDRDRSSKSSSSKSSSKSSSASSSSKSSQPKEKRDSIDDKIAQSMKDKDTLTKVIPPSITKLGKIPKKPATPAADGEAATESVSTKKSSISIEVKKDTENRPKTVKTFNSQFRSHGLAEEAPPPPSRRGLQRPSSQPTAGASIPATILTKRPSPPPEKKDAVVPEKKLKIDTALAVEKPGIKLIPAKPKTPVLVESDMFMDAIFASTTKKDSGRKRKRLTSQSSSETTKPEKVQSPDSKSVAPKFYQDTLESDNKEEDKAEDPKKIDGDNEDEATTTKAKETDDSADVVMQETAVSTETQDPENVVVENKKPPGPGCGPNGPPGVLTIFKRKGPKKQLRWRPQESLEEVHFFELDETERTNVSRNNIDQQSVSFNEREGEAFLIARKMNPDDSMTEQVPWKPLHIVDDVPEPPLGSGSKEKKIQSDREMTCLRAIYFNRAMIPESPAEPDQMQYQITDATIIPLDDANGSPEGIKSFVNYPWPEPRGSPKHQAAGFEDQPFNNFQPNFPFNNQPGWVQPVLPPAFNAPHGMLNMGPIQGEPVNNMNMAMAMNPMNPMQQFQHNGNFGPPNGVRNGFNGNFANGNDGRMHNAGPQQNNPNWFRPNGAQNNNNNNNFRPPNNNGNSRPRHDWNPRNICRAFSKGFCRHGDKCQWLHPGINCPPFN